MKLTAFPSFRPVAIVIVFVVTGGVVARAAEPDAGSDAFFENSVRPVLAERCFKCHAETSEKVKGGLKLDSREAMLKGGESGPSVVPGKPEESRLIVAVGYKDPDLQMPPKSRLPADQVAALTAWVKAGAPWPKGAGRAPVASVDKAAFDLAKRKAGHWAWRPVTPHKPPAVRDETWPADPVDRFVLFSSRSMTGGGPYVVEAAYPLAA